MVLIDQFLIGSKVKHKTKGVEETIVGFCKVKVNDEWVPGIIYTGNDYTTNTPMTFVRTLEDFTNNFELCLTKSTVESFNENYNDLINEASEYDYLRAESLRCYN